MVAMPSQAVDIAWHEFILCTREYERFSQKSFGRFLHHTPTEVMKTPTKAQEGLKRIWRLACAKESISPSKPHKLPLIFGLDKWLEIEDGFHYALDCKSVAVLASTNNNATSGDYCAGHIGCASGCVGESGASHHSGSFFGSDSTGDSGSASCGSGCGGGS